MSSGCIHIGDQWSSNLKPPSQADTVYREDCTLCFDSIDDEAGLDVCLQCFNGGCAGDRLHSRNHSFLTGHPLALNIRRTRKIVHRDEPPAKISKLAIAAETESDRYDTTLTLKCLECGIADLDKTGSHVAPVIESIMKANTFSRKEEVKAWEHELTSCEHILTLQQHEPRQIASQDLGHCSSCDLKENLWLCLECGNLGCGRAQFGGVGGNSHALGHKNETQHGVAVKLGSITPEGTADVYCYTCDEERVDDDLAAHLAHWGIMLSERQKTEKSLTEMQIEQNLRWEFSMTDEDGRELKPLFGPGLTGLKNLGNSCYLNSILQCLFDLPSFQHRYLHDALDILQSGQGSATQPAENLEIQLRKLADGLLSGRYSKPDSDVIASEYSPEIRHQKGLAPSMLKHLVGRGHPEFCTMRQQDAFELLQHLFKLISRTKAPEGLEDPTLPFRFTLEQKLQCLSCKKVRYSNTEQDSIFIDVPLEKLPAENEGGEAPKYKPVELRTCLTNLTSPEVVELTCPSCGSKDGFTKQTLFKTFPDVLVVNARKMAVVNWVPVKVDVPVLVGNEPFTLDEYMSKGQQPDEEALPDDEATSGGTAAFVPDATAFAQLEAMGFPTVRCEKALHATGNSDANAAMEWLFAHMEDPDIDVPLDLGAGSGGSGAATADPEKIQLIGAMGFTEPQAKKALRETAGDVERAVDWLFNHPDDQGDVAGNETADAAPSSQATGPAGSDELPARFQLRSIVCHKGTSIHAGHYVAFVCKTVGTDPNERSWVLYNDEKVVEVVDVEEMKKFAYVYFFKKA